MRSRLNWIRPPGPGRRRPAPSACWAARFDPAHGGHLYVSETALQAAEAGLCLVAGVAGQSAKAANPARWASAWPRAAACRGITRLIRVTDIEQQLGTRYTIDTVKALQRRFPQVQFRLADGQRQSGTIRPLAALAGDRRASFPSRWCAGPVQCWRRFMRHWRGGWAWPRRLGPRPSLVVLDGARNWESSTILRPQALGAAAEAMLNLTPDREGMCP